MEEEETTQRQWEHLSYWEGSGMAGKFPVVLESRLQLKLEGEITKTSTFSLHYPVPQPDAWQECSSQVLKNRMGWAAAKIAAASEVVRGQKEKMREDQGMLQFPLKLHIENAAIEFCVQTMGSLEGLVRAGHQLAKNSSVEVQNYKKKESKSPSSINLSLSNFNIGLKKFNKISRGFFNLGIQALKQNLLFCL